MKRFSQYFSIALVVSAGIFFDMMAVDGGIRHEDEKQRREAIVEQIQQLAPKKKKKISAPPTRKKEGRVTRGFQSVDVSSLHTKPSVVDEGGDVYSLDLSFSNLTFLDEFALKLTDLWGIENITNIGTVTILNLTGNNIKWIDEWLFKEHLPNLQVLNLTGNSITQVPDLSKFSSTLTTLNL